MDIVMTCDVQELSVIFFCALFLVPVIVIPLQRVSRYPRANVSYDRAGLSLGVDTGLYLHVAPVLGAVRIRPCLHRISPLPRFCLTQKLPRIEAVRRGQVPRKYLKPSAGPR